MSDPRTTVAARMRACLPLKLALIVLLNPLVLVPYAILQRHVFFAPHIMAASWLDRLVPFDPRFVWLYLSLNLLMPIAPFLMTKRAHLLRYAAGMALTSLVADVLFLFYPTMCARPEAADASFGYGLLVAIETPFNALPSLHAGFAVFSCLAGEFAFREMRRPQALRAALWIWTAAIFYSTIATRQHVIVDLAAGSALALVAFACTCAPALARIGIFDADTISAEPSSVYEHET